MTQKDKQLLLADLCARLPYGVKIRMIHYEIKGADPEYADDTFSTMYYNMIDYDDESYEFLPYLRPMSSMTEEEDKEFALLQVNVHRADILYAIDCTKVVEWLNKHHFDYRGLIGMGLALEAPEGMYKIEEQ